MSSLLTAPYTLSRGEDIRVIVQAFNSRGGSELSDPSTANSVLAQTVPMQMASPTRLTTSTISQIDV